MLTKASPKKAVFDRVIKDVLEVDADDPLAKALDFNGITSIQDILSMSDNNILNLKYKALDLGKQEPVPMHARNLLKIMKALNKHMIQTFNVRNVNWSDETIINNNEFDAFCINDYNPDDPYMKSSIPAQP